MDVNYYQQRILMVENQLIARGISDINILEAFRKVPRELFVPNNLKKYAYLDRPLPIGYGVTISQPYVVALMIELLNIDSSSRVLDIGTGSGYQAAILSKICKEVVTIEIIKPLYRETKKRLQHLGYSNSKCILGDGSKGYRELAPYDAIISAAATKGVPQQWREQINNNGYIVFPQGRSLEQKLVRIQKNKSGYEREEYGVVSFVPLVKDGRGNRT
mgnify:CR=1 FL=1